MTIYMAKLPPYNINLEGARSQLDWCKENFGLTDEYIEYKYGNNIAGDLRWWKRQGHLFFRNEQDYVLFTLRWC